MKPQKNEKPIYEREKIEEAISLCEQTFLKFFEEVEKILPKEDSRDFIQFLLQETFFAGGVFRSIATETIPNDIDVFFRSTKAVVKFKDFLYTPKNKGVLALFNVTKNDTFILNHKKYTVKTPPLTFVTGKTGEPSQLMNTFDFSFNQNWYSMFDGGYNVDYSCFSKNGRIRNFYENPFNCLERLIRFSKEGFVVPQEDFITLILHITTLKNTTYEDIQQALKQSSSSGSQKGYNAEVIRELHRLTVAQEEQTPREAPRTTTTLASDPRTLQDLIPRQINTRTFIHEEGSNQHPWQNFNWVGTTLGVTTDSNGD